MPRYTQPRKTWFYPVNFKIKAVELSLRDDVMSKDVAEALDIHPLMLRNTMMPIAQYHSSRSLFCLSVDLSKI